MSSSSEKTPTLSSLCVELLAEAQSKLGEPDALANEETVHDVRVMTKQLRAAWRLSKGTAPKGLVKRRRKELRVLSGHLSDSRDQAVLVGLCRDLALHQRDEATTIILTRMAENLRLHPVESVIQPCSEVSPVMISAELGIEKEAWTSLDWGNRTENRKRLRRQIRKSERRASVATKRASKTRSPEIWHEWRKAVKQLRYQREFLAQLQGRSPGKRDQRITRLGTRLGQRNDLANLTLYAESLDTLSGSDHGRVRQAIARAEKEICRNCVRLGRRYF